METNSSPAPVIAVVGLGYVGLPLAVEFSKHYPTIGYDYSGARIESCRTGSALADVLEEGETKPANLLFTKDPGDIAAADVVIVAVPTPVDESNRPDLSPLVLASQIVGRYMKKGATVVYESTVYPGATEAVCVPELVQASGLHYGLEFFVGYSPERVVPGTSDRTVTNIVKVVSGNSDKIARLLANLYGKIITAGIHIAPSIAVAEAAKVFENIQRDTNIALVNELAMFCNKAGLRTKEVLTAAATKWNFAPYQPGLVGGHCIGVDPYYLTYKAGLVGAPTEVIDASRRVNNSMAKFIAQETVRTLVQMRYGYAPVVTVLGATFKENCDDIRNSKVADLVKELTNYGITVQVSDPIADPDDYLNEYGIKLTPHNELVVADAVIVAVAHTDYQQLKPIDLKAMLRDRGLLVDIKNLYEPEEVTSSGFGYWSL